MGSNLRELTREEQDVLKELRKVGAYMTADAVEREWLADKNYYLDTRLDVPKRVRASFNTIQKEREKRGRRASKFDIEALFEAKWRELCKPAEYCGVGVSIIDKQEARKLFHSAVWLSTHGGANPENRNTEW